ncbi:MAG TPA: hypothetical protein EYQ83_17765 [Acidobacteria bacterium]|nr:hypothetical protein [Acidobacteriota bacterium]
MQYKAKAAAANRAESKPRKQEDSWSKSNAALRKEVQELRARKPRPEDAKDSDGDDDKDHDLEEIKSLEAALQALEAVRGGAYTSTPAGASLADHRAARLVQATPAMRLGGLETSERELLEQACRPGNALLGRC